MKPFALSSSELLMLCNHCPTSPVELHLLIEESEERIDEQQEEKILKIVRRHGWLSVTISSYNPE